MGQKNLKSKITAIAITFNDAKYFPQYIENLSFADEIIIIDCNSTDKIKAIAKENGVIIYNNDNLNFSNPINFAISKSSNDWIVYFEINEKVTPEIANEIRTIDLSNKNNVAYTLQRRFIFLNKTIGFGGFQTRNIVKLFNKKYCKFDDKIKIKKNNITGNIAKIGNQVLEYNAESFDNYNNKLSFYADLQAESLYYNKIRTKKYDFFLRPTYRFFWQYFFRLGFLDGKEGFILANLHSFAVFKRYLLLWMKYRKIEK